MKNKKRSGEEPQSVKFWVSPLFFILAAFLLYFGFGFALISYLVTVTVHEFAHASAAKRLGYVLGGMKLMPYGANLKGEFDSARVRDEILIALAGPAVNLVMAVATVAVWWLAPAAYVYTETFVFSNIFTAVFNLLPLFPLDGGRITLAALSVRFKRQSVYKVMRYAGAVAAAGFAALFFCTFYFTANLSLALISVFFFLSTVIPDKHSKYRRLYSMGYRSEKLKKGMAVREVLVASDAELLSLVKMLNANYFYRFTVVDANFKKLGEVSELELEDLTVKFGGNLPIGSVLSQARLN